MFRLQRDAGDTAAFYVIDLVDLEQVAPALPKPAECTSITAYGAVPNDGLDDTAAIQAAVTADQNGQISCVWIPEGQWRQEKKILTDDPLNRGMYNQVGISNVTIRGAGMWRSQLYSLIEPQDANTLNHPHEGNFGFDIDKGVQISDIAIFGSGRIRGGDGNDEGGVGLNGRFGTGTTISNVWIEHANVGVWVGRDYDNIPELWGPADGLAVHRHAHPRTPTPTGSTSPTAPGTRGCSTRRSAPPVTTRWPSGPTRTSRTAPPTTPTTTTS